MADSQNGKPKLRPGDPGYVGRGVPPAAGKIRPGETRNPWGRKGKPQTEDESADYRDELAALLAAPIPAKDGKLVSATALAINKLLKKVNAEDLPSIKFYFELREKLSARPAAAELAEITEHRRRKLVDEALSRREAKRLSEQQDVPDRANVSDSSSDVEAGK